MILKRIGNKQKIAMDIYKYFPQHKIYLEVFFGAGGMFFKKPAAKYNLVNDIDGDVFNLYQVVQNQKDELKQAFFDMPLSTDLFYYWKEYQETEPIKKALRFLMLSNHSLFGKNDTYRVKLEANYKKVFYRDLENTFKLIEHVQFLNYDFRKFFKCLSFKKDKKGINIDAPKSFIYLDPPYLKTVENYNNGAKWSTKDINDLFDCVEATKCRFAYSEFKHPFILEQAAKRKLNIIEIGERRTLGSRRTEILLTNYDNTQLNLFDN